MSDAQVIALVAGYGLLPVEFAKSVKAAGHNLVIVAVQDDVQQELQDLADSYYPIKIGKFGSLIKIIKDHSATQVAFAGGIKKMKIFDVVNFDLTALNLMRRSKAMSDDVILREIAKEIEKQNARVISPTDFLPESVPAPGFLTNRKFTKEESENIEVAIPAALGIGKLDIGQSVVVANGLITAVEAIDGTDATIKRGGEVAYAKNPKKENTVTLVKVCKPQQDLRFDLPSIGPDTITNCEQAGIKSILVEAGRSLILNKDETIALANQKQIAIEARDLQELAGEL